MVQTNTIITQLIVNLTFWKIPKVFLSLLVLITSCSGSDPYRNLSVTQALNAALRDAEASGFAGVALVASNDKLFLHQGVGLANREKDIPWSSSTVFDMGSVTKGFTAATILELQERGRLSVSDQLADYIPGVPEEKQNVTLHHLLTHSAGFPDAIGDDYEAIEREAYVKQALQTPLQFQPGTKYMYSNVGYSLLAAVVERVTNHSFEEFLHESLLQPAGMTHTGYVKPKFAENSLASGYGRDGFNWGSPLDHPWADDGPYWHLRGNGGLLTTTKDLLKWHQVLERGKILKTSTLTQAFTPYVREQNGLDRLFGESYYGYGWVVDKEPHGHSLLWHDGGNGYFSAYFARLPEQNLVIITAGNSSYKAWTVGETLIQIAAR